MSAPSKRQLEATRRELKRLPQGAQRAVGGSIFMRLDRAGRCRSQFRLRDGLGQGGGTYDSWEEADAARRTAVTEVGARAEIGDAGPLGYELRRMTLTAYSKEWWQSVMVDLDVLTQHDYKRSLQADVLPLIGHLTLEQIENSPLLVDHFKSKLVKHKTFKPGHRRAGELPRAACDHALTVGSSICEHARRRGILSRNPFKGITRFGQQRTPNTLGGRSNYRRVKPSEVMHPRTVSLAASGIRGTWVQIEERRGALELLGFLGLRSSEICAARHSDWRDANGPKRFMTVSFAIKNVGGRLLLGEPKTGTREVYLFDAVAEQLERIYIAQGRPLLDSLVAPNIRGTFQDWGNWRDRYWYPALHRAGISDAPEAAAPRAFDPYLLRHILAGAMTHAVRPVLGGTYSRAEVARQLGHSVPTLDRVYADIPPDLHGIAGLTMDEIIRAARRDVFGPMPGETDFDDEFLTMHEAAGLTGIGHKSLAARIYRGTLPGREEGGRKLVSRFDLMWCGLLS